MEVFAMDIRPSVFSGAWYPDKADACRDQISQFLKEGEDWAMGVDNPIGGIVPHAGWYFSGSIACNVMHHIAQHSTPDLVVVFGMHLHPGSSSYIMPDGAWETPFGEIPVASSMAGELTQMFSFQIETPSDFSQDNTIELQLPFIKYFFKDVNIIAMGVPPSAQTVEMAKTVVDLAKKNSLEMVVIGSTDLTHYGANYGFTGHGRGKKALKWVTEENDKKAIDAMLTMDYNAVLKEAHHRQNACCSGAVAAALAAGNAMGRKKAGLLKYTTSYEKSPGESFVGYAGLLF